MSESTEKKRSSFFKRMSRASFGGMKTTHQVFNKVNEDASANERARMYYMSIFVDSYNTSKDVERWSKQQLLYWLKVNNLSFITPLFDENENNKKNVGNASMFIKDESKGNSIKLKSASLESVLEYISMYNQHHITKIWDHQKFIKAFVTTHSSFVNVRDILLFLEERFKSVPNLKFPYDNDYDEDDPDNPLSTQNRHWNIKESIVNFISEWKHYVVYELAVNQDMLKQFNTFCDTHISRINLSDTKLIKVHVKKEIKRITRKKEKTTSVKGAPPPIVPKKWKDGICHIHPKEIARQMTLIEEKIFTRIGPREFLKQAWNKANHEVNAPNITLLTRNFNKMINWITTEILKLTDTNSRAEVITLFIRVAKHFTKLKNYNGVMQVLSSLHSSAISRLKQSWSIIQPKYKETFDSITELMSNVGNFKTFRDLYASIEEEEPCIPFIAIFLTDCTYLDDTMPDRLDNGWINWEKFVVFDQKIREIRRFKMNSYQLVRVPEIHKLIDRAETWDDNKTLYAISQISEGTLNVSGDPVDSPVSKKSDLRSSYKKFNRVTVANMNLRSLYLRNRSNTNNVELSQRDWKILLSGANLNSYKDGDIILDEGAVNNSLYKIELGMASVRKLVDGKHKIIGTIGKNEMFGEISILQREEGGTTTATILSNGETTVWVVPIEFVLNICKTDHMLSEKIHRIFAQKLAKKLRELSQLRQKPRTIRSISSKREKSDVTQDGEKETPSTPEKPIRSISKRTLSIDRTNQTERTPPRMRRLASQSSIKKDEVKSEKREEVKVEKDKEKDKKIETDPDVLFRKKFNLKNDSYLLKEFDCAFKGKIVTHCTLYISQEYICYSSSIFGLKTRLVFAMNDISSIEKLKQSIVITCRSKTYRFISFKFIDESYDFIRYIWEKFSTNRANDGGSNQDDSENTIENSSVASKKENNISFFELTPSDWELILKGANIVSYGKNESIIQEGDSFQRIFQLVRGSVRIEKKQGDVPTVLGKLSKEDSIFGEISFLEGGSASASIVADEDNTEVYIIEGYFLNVLFERNMGLSGRFYHYLAKLLSKRIKSREEYHRNNQYSDNLISNSETKTMLISSVDSHESTTDSKSNQMSNDSLNKRVNEMRTDDSNDNSDSDITLEEIAPLQKNSKTGLPSILEESLGESPHKDSEDESSQTGIPITSSDETPKPDKRKRIVRSTSEPFKSHLISSSS